MPDKWAVSSTVIAYPTATGPMPTLAVRRVITQGDLVVSRDELDRAEKTCGVSRREKLLRVDPGAARIAQWFRRGKRDRVRPITTVSSPLPSP
jgi:hypothetical protein